MNARQRLLQLLEPERGWTDRMLRDETGLNITLLKEVMAGLLEERLVQQRYNASGRTEFVLAAPPLSSGELLEGPVSEPAERVLKRLQSRPEGVASLAKALNLSPAVAMALIEDLERLGRVTRTQVGMLVIYRVSTSG